MSAEASAFIQSAGTTFAVILALPVFLVLWKSASTMGALQKTVSSLEETTKRLTDAVAGLTTLVAVHANDIETLKKAPAVMVERRGRGRRADDVHGGDED